MSDFSQRIVALSAEKRALLEAHLKKKSPAAGRALSSTPRTGKMQSFPVSYAEQRLWFLDQWQPQNPIYNIGIAYTLEGDLDVAVLERSVKEIVARHESLRTSFSTRDGEPVQVVHPGADFNLDITDLGALPEAQREAEARALASRELQSGFDLARAPLLRIKLLRLAADRHVLLIVIHHIVSDGWSMGVFRSELSELYSSYSRGIAPSLPELPIQYGDYSVWQRQWLRSRELEKQVEYWKSRLKGAPPLLELPADRPRPPSQSFKGTRLTRMLPKRLCEDLKTLSQSEGATLFMSLLAGFQILLSRYSRSNDITLGSPIAGRMRAETENLIGFFVNTLALRTDLSGDPAFRELLDRVRETALGAYAHQDLPFEKLVEELNPERSLSHSPLFQVMFVLHNTESRKLRLPGIAISELEFERVNTKFDLSLAAVETAGGARLRVEYSTDLFDAETITRLLGHYENLLQGIVVNPHARISELAFLTDIERDRLLVEWSNAPARTGDIAKTEIAQDPDSIKRSISRITPGDEPLFTSLLADSHWNSLPLSYDGSFAFYCHRAGYAPMKFYDGSLLAAFHSRNEQYFVLRPLGLWNAATMAALANYLFALNGRPVTFLKLCQDQFAQLSSMPGFSPIQRSNNLHDIEDDRYAQLVIRVEDLLPAVEDSAGVAMGSFPKLAYLRRALRTFEKRYGGSVVLRKLDANTARDAERVVRSWAEDFRGRYQREHFALPDDDRSGLIFSGSDDFLVRPYQCLLENCDTPNNFGFVAYIESQPAGLLFLARTSENCAALYANLALTKYRGLAYHLLFQAVKELAARNISYLNLGGQETNTLRRFYLRFNPFTLEEREYRSYETQYCAADFESGRKPTSDDVKCIPDLFESHAERTPEGAAVIFEDETLTYVELNRKANRLAHQLRSLGVAPETVVGLFLPRSAETMVAIMAIFKAGGAYLPLDPAYPKERLAFMLEDSRVAVVITSSKLAGALPETSAKRVLLDDAQDSRYPETNPGPGAGADHLAYVIYTSGSTGQPKGVMITHRALAAHIQVMRDHYGLSASDRVLQFASLNFDVSLEQILTALTSGAGLVVRGDEIWSPADFCEHARRFGLTVANLPTAYWQQLVDEWTRDPGLARSHRLRLVTAGGEAMHAESLRRWRQTPLSNIRLLNCYGPTETTITATFFEVPRDNKSLFRVPIGRPVANAEVYILDSHHAPTPIGVPGELYIGGDRVARGYLNRPELTPEKFIPSPFSKDPHARLYKTGDLARYLSDGAIEFLGRIDTQVKIRGFRIELGEIESVLNQHLSVTACAVLMREDEPGDKRLVAYVAAGDAHGDASPGELRAFLKDKLPEYMLPSAVVVLDQLPMTSTGKIDRKALPAPEYRSEASFVAPRTPNEQTLAAIWGEVLKLEKIGVHDNFFQLGGHSLLATRVIARARAAFNIELPLRALFEMPTVEALSAEVTRKLDGRAKRGAALIPRRTASARAPLSFAQQRLWFLDQLEPMSAAYIISATLRITGALNVPVLNACLLEIVRRHEALRTTFAMAGDDAVQVIHAPHEFDLPVVDLSHVTLKARDAEALRLASVEMNRAFDLTRGPLFRASLLRLDAHIHVLIVSVHHIVSDGWSIGIFYRELAALYRAFNDGKPSPLAELPVQYADYAIWQQGWFEKRELQQQLSYWKKQLDAAPALSEFPTDYLRPAIQRYRGARESLTLSRRLGDQLKRLSRREGVTLFMTLLAAFETLLYRYSGQHDIVIGTHSAGRNRYELEGVIGFFIGTLALRADLSGNPPFRQLLARVRETALNAYANQDVPFERLIGELQPERSLSHTPLVQVVFNMLNLPEDRAIELPGLAVEHVPRAKSGAKFDLTVHAREQNGDIALNAVYDIDLFAAATIERLLRHFETLLQSIVANPDCRLSQLPMAGSEETNAGPRSNDVRPAQAFIEFDPGAIEQSIGERFEEQARKYANRLAVKTRIHEWNYAQLDRAANRVVQALLDTRGAGAERIALLLDHDAPMIGALLGVLKTGKSYVALDPAYPTERLAYMLADAQVQVLLTNSANLALAKSLGALQLLNIDALDAPVSNTGVPVTPDAIAYTLYTSGSTGKPKGVVQNHRNVLHFIRAYTNNLHINADDKVTLFSAYTVDSSVQDIFAALLNGAALYPLDLKQESLSNLAHWLVENEITLYHSTPSAYRYFIRALQGEAFPALRLVVLGGEAVVKNDVDAYKKHFSPGCLLVNGFGLTESTVNLQYFIDPRTEIVRHAVPIGYPVANTGILLLDEAGDPTELYGEIGIVSPHVALGYWNQPELSKQKFLADPGDSTRRIYRTGDMGRRLAGGSLEFAGRKDDQVKVRGYRIELREIEAALSAHPVVRECVASLKGNDGDRRLIAYVVSHDGASFTPAELRDFLRNKLPDYMIPAVFMALDRLPLTPSGKIHHRELPAPDNFRADTVFEAPRTPNEQTLAGILGALLKLDRVGIHDNFFDLGGHSLLATQVVSRIKKTFGADIQLRALFESPTVAGLSALIVQQQAEALGENELAQLLAEAQRVQPSIQG